MWCFLTCRECGLGLQYAPYILELDEATRYVWCQCGVSMKQPFCDSTSHRSSPLLPPDAMRAVHAAFALQQPVAAWCGYTEIDVKSTSNQADVAPPRVRRRPVNLLGCL